jgi:hypothetical protein
MSTPNEGTHKRLPAKPSVENLKKQARRLAKDQPSLSLQQAQHQLAKSYGCANWDALLVQVAAMHESSSTPSASSVPYTVKNVHIRREGSRHWIEPIPLLDWHKTGQSTVIASLAAALSVLDSDSSPLVTPKERTLAAMPAKTGPAWDYNTLMDDSAMAFRIRWHRRGGFRQTSAKPATWWAFTMAYAGGPEDEALLQRSTGWRFEGTPYCYPNNAKPVEELPKIRASIDGGLPVVACLPEEFGVIHGYDIDSNEVYVTAYQNPGKAFWIPITDVGTKLLILASPQPPIPRHSAGLAALHTAVSNWSRGDVAARDGGVFWEDTAIRLQYGAVAYEEWADDLRHAHLVPERSRRQLWTASAFNMTCLSDARWAAAGYLRSVRTILPESKEAHLNAAAAIYEDLSRQTSELRSAGREFFGVWYGQSLEDWSTDLRDKETALLENFARLDAAAITEIQNALTSVIPGQF